MPNVREIDLDKLNSATKYPSIQTYHALGKKGRLTDEVQVDFSDVDVVYGSEKVDGTNTRTIMFSDGTFIVGSRNDLLWYSEDLLYNPAQNIVDVMRDVLTNPPSIRVPDEGKVRVYFGESYGGKITGQSKQYSKSGTTGFRMFDIIEFDEDDLLEVLAMSREDISSWRESGGQPFLLTSQLPYYAGKNMLTPRLEVGVVPTDHQEVLDWLETLLPETQCKLDETGLGNPEGIIIRSDDRSRIAKVRYQDYRRTLHQRQKRR